MQTDLDALKTESLGSILRECQLRPADLLCTLFSLDGLELNGSPTDTIDENSIRLISSVPVHALLDAANAVIVEAELQHELKLERKQLVRDGVFIPMLRYEHSLENSRSSKISGGIVPPSDASAAPLYQSSYTTEDNSRLENTMSQATDGSSRIDL
jgi:hypothetical protein